MRVNSNNMAVRLLALAFMVAAALPHLSLPDTWKGTHWLFRLEDGVLRRALAGSLLGAFQGDSPVSLRVIAIASASVCTLFAIVISIAIAQALQDPLSDGSHSPRIRWQHHFALVYFATAPGGLLQHLSDMGRFDVIGTLLIALGLLLTQHWHLRGLERGVSAQPSQRRELLTPFMVLSTAAILFHEAFALWVVPLFGLVWWWHSDRSRQAAKKGTIGLVTLALVTLLAWTFDYGRVMPLDEARELLATRANFPVADPSLMIHFRDLSANTNYTQARAWRPERLIGLTLASTVLLPQLAILVALLRITRRGHPDGTGTPPSTIWFLGASVSPLTLMLLGHDQGRWLAMSSFTITCLSLLVWADVRRAGMTIPRWLITLMLVTAALQIVSGPFGITSAMPAHPLSTLLRS